MYFLICFVIIAALSYHQKDFIRKNNVRLYWFAFAVSLTDVIFQIYLLSQKIRLQGPFREFESLISRGILGTAIIAVVMVVGALNNKQPYTRRFLSIRAELSIIACILILPHNIVYAYYSLLNLTKVLAAPPSNFKTVSLCISISGILAVTIMIPLFITSFRVIRNKMKAKTWKKLQSLSYLFYFLVYFQVMMIYLGYENRRSILNALAYSMVFIPYGILRVKKGWTKNRNPLFNK